MHVNHIGPLFHKDMIKLRRSSQNRHVENLIRSWISVSYRIF